MKIQARKFNLAWIRRAKCDKREVTLQDTLKYSVFLIKAIVNDFWMNSLKSLEPEKQMERRTGELQTKVKPMKSSVSPSAHQSHPYSQKLIPQQRNQNILRTAQKGSSVHDLGRSFPFVPKRFTFTAGEVGTSWLSHTIAQLWEHVRPKHLKLQHTHHECYFYRCRYKPPSSQLPCPAHKYYCIHITVCKMMLRILLICNARPAAHHRLEFSSWRTK